MPILKQDWIEGGRKLTIVSTVILLILFSGSLLFIFAGDRLIEWGPGGESIEFIKRLIVEGKKYDLPHPQIKSALLRIAIVVDTLSLLLFASVLNPSLRRIIKNFFTETTHPTNLAFFRIVLFFTVIVTLDVSDVVWFSEFPRELLFAPTGLKWLFGYLPLNESWAKLSSILFLLFCFTGMIGLFTRTSALLALIFGFYVLGIPQFFGKVRHYHHLIWFLAILAASRCGDALSIDAVLAARKRADQGMTDPPESSRVYALPLRFVWLLMGVMYFFPGFWKFVWGGTDWALSDNLKFRLYKTWFEFGDWAPFFRIDHYPFLYKLAALATMIFELSFIFIIFFPGMRLFAAFGGILFHNLTNLFMRIPFWWLQPCYVSFFDWNLIFRRIGRWIYRDEMKLFYDPSSRRFRRNIAYLRVFDVFGRIVYVNVNDGGEAKTYNRDLLDPSAMNTDMCVSVGSRRLQGFRAYKEIAKRVPVFWPVLPFLYILALTKMESRIFRRREEPQKSTLANQPCLNPDRYKSTRPGLTVLTTVGVFLICVNSLCGLGHLVSAWPFACYPTFERVMSAGSKIESLSISLTGSGGESISLEGYLLNREVYWSRSLGLIQHILSTDDEELMHARLRALWRVWSDKDARLMEAHTVRFYKVVLSPIPPEDLPLSPVKREFLYELQL